jgi:hypothetical protein
MQVHRPALQRNTKDPGSHYRCIGLVSTCIDYSPLVAVYRMTATVALYARPEIVRGEQCAKARLARRSDTEQLPGHCGRYGRAGNVAIAEPS